MHKKLFTSIKTILKPLLVVCLVFTLVFSQADGALAARSGGRIGGGSFRAPSRVYTSPSRPYSSPGGYGGGYYPGGGIGFPFLIPLFGFGGGFGGLFTILIFISIASFLVRSFRRASDGDMLGSGNDYSVNPTVSVSRLQVGLLAEARTLQADLEAIARRADTGSSEGLAQVLQESTLALLRHPEYWVYAGAENQVARLESAEAQFNRFTLTERSKFAEETLSNVGNQLQQAAAKAALTGSGELAAALAEGPSEYIVVTLVTAAQGKLDLPAINSADDLRQVLSRLGGVSSDRLLALEVLWTPQAEGDTLSAEDFLTQYPNLKRV